MWILYLLGVRAYGFAIRVATLFNPKAKEWIIGRRGWQRNLSEKFEEKLEKRIWFHCSSLGEFEQGRPVLEAIKKEYPNHKIVLTFFSPSGYNVKKNDPIADYISYLPLDGPIRSKKFLDLVNPDLAFFVKYEFWYFYGKELQERKIPYFCVSAIFRPGQIFFHSMGNFFRKILLRFTHLFVQDQESLQLLYKERITNVTVSGDTRFDRVFANSLQRISLPDIEKFCDGSNVLVCGSTWPHDEELLIPFINQKQAGLKFIIAPHEISASQLQKLKNEISLNVCYYSEFKNNSEISCDVLVIDNVGLLSKLYQYANYAYIGGGFGKGIHNILEAVVYGVPVFIGPNYEKFREARDLVKLKGVFVINNKEELERNFDILSLDNSKLQNISKINKHYVDERKGGTEVIMGFLRMNNKIN